MGTLAANIAASATPAGANPLTAGVAKGTMETLHTLGAAAGKVIPNSWRDALGLPSSFKEPDYLTSTNGAETAGKVAENIAEFAMGDEALKGLQITERLGIAQKMASMAKSSPYIAKILEHGLTAVRGGAVTVPQQMLHGATPTEALKTGAEATVLGAGTGAVLEGASALANTETGQAVRNIAKQVVQGKKVAQPGAQSAVREAVQTGVTAANDATAAREAAQSNVKIPDAYKDLVNEAMNQEPAWTPEKAQPIVKALGNDYEIRGSVGEGKVTNNDLDIYQKTGKLSDASDKLADLGFKQAYKTDHGEVWTNEKTGQNVDLWDAQHEPKPGFGPDIPESEPAPVANKKSSAVGNNAPIVKGNTTILDDHLDTLAENEKATYKRMDDTAGFDVKALKDKLKIDKYNLKQLGSSDPDKTGRLVEAINDSTDRIAEANEKMKAAGIDPDEADALHQQRMAGEDFKKVLTTYTNADGSVNVKGLLRGSKQLRFSQYGDRLEQLTGSSDAADKFITQLDAMDKLGAHAIKAQKIAKMIGWGLAIPTGLKVAGSIAHDALVP
jgi:hypothetical protein